MCYKVIKATALCSKGHVAAATCCWRHCSFVPDLQEGENYLNLCFGGYGKQASIFISDMHEEHAVATKCRFCDIYDEPNFSTMIQEAAEDDVELANLNARLTTIRSEIGRGPPIQRQLREELLLQTNKSIVTTNRINNRNREFKELFDKRSETIKQEWIKELDSGLYRGKPIFYYGPHSNQESTESFRTDFVDLSFLDHHVTADTVQEYVVDWSKIDQTKKVVMCFSFQE